MSLIFLAIECTLLIWHSSIIYFQLTFQRVKRQRRQLFYYLPSDICFASREEKNGPKLQSEKEYLKVPRDIQEWQNDMIFSWLGIVVGYQKTSITRVRWKSKVKHFVDRGCLDLKIFILTIFLYKKIIDGTNTIKGGNFIYDFDWYSKLSEVAYCLCFQIRALKNIRQAQFNLMVQM